MRKKNEGILQKEKMAFSTPRRVVNELPPPPPESVQMTVRWRPNQNFNQISKQTLQNKELLKQTRLPSFKYTVLTNFSDSDKYCFSKHMMSGKDYTFL